MMNTRNIRTSIRTFFSRDFAISVFFGRNCHERAIDAVKYGNGTYAYGIANFIGFVAAPR